MEFLMSQAGLRPPYDHPIETSIRVLIYSPLKMEYHRNNRDLNRSDGLAAKG